MAIQISKTSPARVALHETLDRVPKSSLFGNDGPEKTNTMDLNQLVAKDSSIRGVRAIHYKKVNVSPMHVPRESAMKILDEQAFLENLPEAHRRRLDLAQERSQVLNQDWNLPTTRDLFAEKIDSIKRQTPQAVQNSGIYVAASDANGRWTTPEESKKNVGVDLAPPSSDPQTNNGYVVRGALSIPNAADAPMLPGYTLEVRHIDQGVAKEPGKIDLEKGNYSIQVSDLTGYISSKMFNEKGKVVASGRFILNPSLTSQQLQVAAIEIKPRNDVSGQYVSFYDQASRASMTARSNNRRNPSPKVMVSAFAEEVKADVDGFLKVEGLHEGSWSFLRSEAKGFYPSLSLTVAGETKVHPLFPAKMMQALLSLVREARGPGPGGETGAVIWGQVKSPVSGAGIQVQLEDAPDIKPVYLNELLIPDEKLTSTTASGYFAFVDLPRGFYSVRALRKDRQIAVGNVEVDNETASTLELNESMTTHPVQVSVYDGFTGSPQQAHVEIQNFESSLPVQGLAEIRLPSVDHLNLVQVTPASEMYVPALYAQNSQDDYIHLPLVRSDWLLGLRAYHRMADQPQSGTIVGFVPSTGFEVHLPHLENQAEAKVIYFDAQGQPSQTGVAGGGFIAFNVLEGSHTVLVIPNDASAAVSKVVPIDSGNLHILKFDF